MNINTDGQGKNARSFTMNDDAEFYNNYSGVQKRDAVVLLNEYTPKLIWKKKEKILDIGCADGSVTKLISTYCPVDFEMEGCDVNVKAIKHAEECYGSERMTFRVMDIETDLPKTLEGKFDHVFSFYTLHWIEDQEKAFRNIYNLLTEDGECFLTIIARLSIYEMFKVLKNTDRWRSSLTNLKNFISPYHDISDPDVVIEKLLHKVGFRYVDVRCRQKIFDYENEQLFRNSLEAVNPFKIDEEQHKHFFDDLMDVARNMKIIDTENNCAKLLYNLIIVHCRK